MLTQRLQLLALLAPYLIFTMSCDVEADDPTFFNDPNNQIELSNPQVGQTSYYVRYTSDCADLNGHFQLTGDTLKMEIVENDGQLYWQESFTKGSPLYATDDGIPHPFILEVAGENLIMPGRSPSSLFYFYGNDTLRLNPEQQEPMVQEGCLVNYNGNTFTGVEIGMLEAFQVGPLAEQQKIVVSCVPIILQLDGYLIYDQKSLRMSHTVTEEGEINGWRILDPN